MVPHLGAIFDFLKAKKVIFLKDCRYLQIGGLLVYHKRATISC